MALSMALMLGATLVRAAFMYGGGAALALEVAHGATDVVATGLVVAAVVLSRSGFARRLPYGLYKLEDLASLGIAIALAYLAVSLGIEGLAGPVPRIALIAGVAQLSSVPLVLGSALVKFVAAREAASPAIRSDAVHTVGDSIEALGVGIGLLLSSYLSTPVAYRASVAIAVAGVCYAAYEAGRDGILALLDLPVDREALEAIKRIVRDVAPGFELRSARCRWAGPALFVELVLEAPPLAVVEDLHALSKRIELEISSRIRYIVSVSTMFVPRRRERIRVCIPCDEPSLDSLVSEHFARARYLAIVDVRGDRIERVEFVESREASGGRERLVGASIAEYLARMGVSDVVVYRMGEIAYALLLRHRIVVWRVSERDRVSRVIEKLIGGELERMVSPTCEEPWSRHG